MFLYKSMKKFFDIDMLLNIVMFAIYYATFLSLFAYFGHWQTGIFYTAFGVILYTYCQADGYTDGDSIVRFHAVGGYVVCLIIYAYYCIKVLKLQGHADDFTGLEFMVLSSVLLITIIK